MSGPPDLVPAPGLHWLQSGVFKGTDVVNIQEMLEPLGPSSASLGPLETPVEPDTRSAAEKARAFLATKPPGFPHESWKNDRRRVLEALMHTNQTSARIRAFVDCSSSAWVLRHKTDRSRFKLVANTCRDRLCVRCAGMRTATVRTNLIAFLDGRETRFITLTLKHRDVPLWDQVNRLYKCFRRLRQRTLWKERVTGGCALLELTYNHQTQRWHPHLHTVIEGGFLPREDLSRAWLDVTGDSWNVDIRLVKNDLRAAHYVTKYLTKPLPTDVLREQHLLEEAVPALAHRRFIVTFGTWLTAKLTKEPSEHDWDLFERVQAYTCGYQQLPDLTDAVLAAYYDWCHNDGPSEFTYHGPAPP